MAENYPKSKLKRKKSSVVKFHPEESSIDTVKRGRLTLFSGDMAAETDGSVVSAVAWWNRQQLPAVESLWAYTLKSALPYLENQHWELVPDLPHPCAERPTALKSDEQQWCDLSGEVAPFPEPSTLSSADPVRSSSSQQDLSTKTEPAPHTSNRQLSSHSRQSKDGQTKRQSSLHSWEEASSVVYSTVGGEERVKRGEEDKESGPVNRQGLRNQLKVSDSRVSPQREGGNEEEVKKAKEAKEVQESVEEDRPGEGVRLQSCPMCLLMFPIGFTQMDCDGHLAQCLSEMNVDMTW